MYKYIWFEELHLVILMSIFENTHTCSYWKDNFEWPCKSWLNMLHKIFKMHDRHVRTSLLWWQGFVMKQNQCCQLANYRWLSCTFWEILRFVLIFERFFAVYLEGWGIFCWKNVSLRPRVFLLWQFCACKILPIGRERWGQLSYVFQRCVSTYINVCDSWTGRKNLMTRLMKSAGKMWW